ncbi:MAG: glycogen/starch synthase [Candidatus Melainabacteria bacterium]|nr:MAG: glycogen/starch synthase [Candidatus Melainabacteria bacterium]
MRPYAAKGGVATVVDDYKNMFDEGKDNQKVMIMPYYNGRRQLEEKNGVKTSKWNGDVKVNKFPQGTKDAKGNDIGDRFYFTNVKLSETSVDNIIKDNKYQLLEEVALDKIEMGDKEYDIGLYRVEGTNHYMVNTLPTARMREAYETNIGGYSSDGGENIPDVFEADDYAVFCKATVKLLPQIKEYYKFDDKDNPTKITGKQAFDPYAILCNDAQTAYIPHYVSQEHENNNEYFKTMNINYVVHNAGEGYIGRTSLKKNGC